MTGNSGPKGLPARPACATCRTRRPVDQMQPALSVFWKVIDGAFVCADRDACFAAAKRIPIGSDGRFIDVPVEEHEPECPRAPWSSRQALPCTCASATANTTAARS